MCFKYVEKTIVPYGGGVCYASSQVADPSSIGTPGIQATFLPVMYISLLFTLYCSMISAKCCIIVFTV